MKLFEIARLCGASHIMKEELAETAPAGFNIDSRSVRPGELFVAIPGERVDGHQFVAEVFEKGAIAAIVVHKRLPFAASLGEFAERLLFVENTSCALQQMAARVLAGWRRPVVGITGSAGKTTIKDLTALVLSASGKVLKSLGNLNTSYGLPLTVSRMITGGAEPGDFDFTVLEMGMSSFGEIACLVNLAPPTVGVIANVGTAHIEFFGTQDRISRAKAEMVDGIKPGGTAVLNADDPRVLGMRERRSDINILTFGIDGGADVMAREMTSTGQFGGTRFVLKTPSGEAEVRLPLIGRYNVYNALAASATAHALGQTAGQTAAQLALASPSKMRGEVLRFANGVTVIDDSYNSNPQALLESVRSMLGAKGFSRRVVVAGEMLELGAEGPPWHRHCGGEICAMGIDRLIGVRGLARELVKGAIDHGMKAEQAEFYETPEEAGERLVAEARPGDLILVKGSRGVRTERVVEKLRGAFSSPGS